MSGRFLKQNTPWEELFDPDIIGDGPQASAFLDEGTPMQFAHVQYGQKRNDIGFTVRIAGVDVDVTSLWAAKGTARYVIASAVPSLIYALSEGSSAPVSSSASISFGRDGVVAFSPADYLPANFLLPSSPTVGDAYKVRFRLVAKSSVGTVTGVLNVFTVINQSLQVTLSHIRNQSGSTRAWADFMIDIHRASDDVHMYTYSVRLEAEASIS